MSDSKAAIDKALQKLSDQLTCPVCLDTYQEPKVLPCLHVFCEACLEKLVSEDGSSLTCPNCRRMSQPPQGGVSGHAAAFYIHHLADVQDTLKKVKETRLDCQHCQENPATGYCRNCSEFYCGPCTEVHKQWKGFKDHTIATTEEVQAEALNFTSAKRATMTCSKHPERQVDMYCETCEQLICQHCVVRTHRDHDYDLVSESLPKHRDTIVVSLQPLKPLLDTVNQAVAEMDSRSRRLAEQTKSVRKKVQQKVNQLHLALESRKDELLAEVDRIAQENIEYIGKQRESYELTKAQLSSCLEYVEESLRTGTPEEVLSIKKQAVERAQEMVSEFNPEDYKPRPEQTIRCNLQHQGLAEACLEFGEVFTRESSSEKASATPEPMPVQHHNGSPTTTTASPEHDETILDIEARTIEVVKEPRGLAIMETGEIVVADRSAECVRILDPHGYKLRSIGKKELNGPHGVAVCSDTSVLVAAEHCVKRFTFRGKLVSSVGTKGSGNLQFDTPLALACNPANQKVYVCDTFNNRIQVLNNNLTFCSTFGTKGTGPGQFSCPTGVTIDKSGNIFVADYHNNRVQVFSPDAEFLREIKQQRAGQEELKGPVSVCLDADDSLYVLESNVYRVSVFNKEGEFVKTFRKRDKAGEFNSLHGIVVNNRGFVYISDTDNHRIQVFQ